MSITPSFQIIRISSCSDIPVRNTAKELIFGNHVLWEGKNTPVDDGGSLSPNVFSYDFTSPHSSNSTLNITLSIINTELYGTNLVLRGTLSSYVFESAVFTAGNADEITIAVCIVNPEPSPKPFSLNGDFPWIIESDKVEHASLDETRLELYWISPNIHEIFLTGLSGIGIKFLRVATCPGNNVAYWSEVTADVYDSYNKTYDTVSGMPQFGVSYYGGYFDYNRYIEGYPTGIQYPIVSCYDQAAMVQILGTLGLDRPSWLFMRPYGFINDNKLIGYYYIPCNNPFFKSNGTLPMVSIDDKNRTGFTNYVFNGTSLTFDRTNNDWIYDACYCGGNGIHLQDCFKFIDHITSLYNSAYIPHPGNLDDIVQLQGVTGVVGGYSGSIPTALKADKDAKKLLSKYATNDGNSEAAYSRSHVHWDDISPMVKTLFGDSCNVKYYETTIGDSLSKVFWHLEGIVGFDGDVIAKVKVHTHVGGDGKLDHEQSSRAAFNELLFTLIDVNMALGPNYERLHDIWVAAPFGDYATYALQYGPHINEGHVLLVCGNSLIDISGGSSSAALEPVIHKLLTHTTVDAPVSLHVPRVSQHLLKIPQAHKVPNAPHKVKGLFASFDVECHVDNLIAAASADTEGHGLLLSKYNIEKDEDNETSKVTFTFVTRKVGVHNVNLRFKKALNMTTSTEKIHVIVMDG